MCEKFGRAVHLLLGGLWPGTKVLLPREKKPNVFSAQKDNISQEDFRCGIQSSTQNTLSHLKIVLTHTLYTTRN